MRQDLKLIRYPLLLVVFMLLLGCQSISTYYAGYISKNQSNLDLAKVDRQQNSWQTFDLKMHYQAEQGRDVLKLAGTVKLGLYYELNAIRINDLSVYLFFVDADSRVVGTAQLVKLTNIPTDDLISFAKTVQVPPKAVAISFGYAGESLEDTGGDDHNSGANLSGRNFYELPKRPSSVSG